MALGVLLLIVALVGTGVDGIPAQGWVAPLLGATTLYLVSAGLSVRTRHATFIIWILLFLPFEAMRHGPEAERKVLPLLESALVVFMGSDVRVGSGEGPQLIGAVGVSTWLLTSGIALLLGFVVFLLLIVTAEQEKWA